MGMSGVLADTYEMTGDTRYLALSKRFCHRAVLDPLCESRGYLDGLHANTQIPNIFGFNRSYQLTEEQNYYAPLPSSEDGAWPFRRAISMRQNS